MSSRNHHRDPQYGGVHRSLGPPPPPALLEEIAREAQFLREAGGPHHHPHHRPPPPPHHHFIEDRLASQHQEIQTLLVDNQRLAATHVALKQELEAAQHELRQMSHIAKNLSVEKDVQLREVYEKSLKLENEALGVEGMKGELVQVRGDVVKLGVVRQELSGQVEGMKGELTRANADLQQVPALKADIETMKQELDRARAAIDYERKGHAERFEQGQAMEKNMILIAREVEKLRAEVANGEMRVRAAAAAGNPGYGGNYTNPDTGYGGNPYTSGYGMNPAVQGGAEGAAQYGPGPGSWSAYDMQRAPAHR